MRKSWTCPACLAWGMHRHQFVRHEHIAETCNEKRKSAFAGDSREVDGMEINIGERWSGVLSKMPQLGGKESYDARKLQQSGAGVAAAED
ncbi:unnamed protein product [Litomosoides sigmodontis]|uniref:Uncharacterized protein n=1 Tax=Litomosoides sigmodontis TaxID=42156 RepID=A0A3P6TX69_LITSI|nr:unnamed protein product [Litomosoides sigmodontis]